MPRGVLPTTSANQIGNSRTVTKHAISTRTVSTPIRLARKHRQAAARPTSHTMYCGLITRLVVVNISTATSAASAAVCASNRVAASRHSSSSPKAMPVSASAAVLTMVTQGPRNSTEP